MDSQEIPKLVAHRGYMTNYPENSWLGLLAAIDAGACWLEFDIQMCADGTFILMHDADLKRTANDERSVFKIDAEELETISVHEPTRFEDRFYPLPISKLDDVLIDLSKYPLVNTMIEIKEESLGHWGLSTVMDRLLDKLKPYSSHSVLISFSYDALVYAKKHSDIKIGLVLEQYNQKGKADAVSLEPDYLICNSKKIPKNKPPWQGPWEWMLYEINSPEKALAWAANGVDYIETADIGGMLNYPALATRAKYSGV